jgi:competence protein ComEC
MLISSIAFVAGVCLLQRSAGLPPACSYVVIPAALFLLRYPAARYPAVLLLGYFWAALQAELALSQTLDRDLEGQTVLVQGTVLDIPRQLSATGIRFPFHVDTLIAANRRLDFAGKVRLNWYETDIRPAAGERWELAVRLKRPHGFANPGGFDYEQWLFQQRIRATGYVRNDSRNKRISRGGVSAISGFRHRLMSVYAGLDQDLPGLALVRALTIGDRSAITSVQWDSLRATGTSHLMAISGLHVSLVAGLVFWLARFGWSRSSGLTRRVPAQKAAALLALGAAVLYAVLAGFAIPTRRAVLMVGVVMLAIVVTRPCGT